MKKCIVCGKAGECHHIIFKSQGGMDIEINYVYLCAEHHRGKTGPHRNKKTDIGYKLKLQNDLIELFDSEYYEMHQLVKILGINLKHVKLITKKLKRYNEGYRRLDIVKYLLGGKFYAEYMLDDTYDESWICYEEDLMKLVL